ncbi:TerB family tellurite resistance protein [Sulfurimonas sp.]|uniref:TerB family tellurite resistance protein n=1 Tax=Sulfurimonas sp. TaxID=2022749 RepID=UPI003D1152DD
MEDKTTQDIKISVAVLLMDMIKTDFVISYKEKEKFVKIFTSYYKTTQEEASELFDKLCVKCEDLATHIGQIKEQYKDDAMQIMTIMKHLNEMIFADWIEDIEYARFEQIKNALVI